MNKPSKHTPLQHQKSGFIFTKHSAKQESIFDRLFGVFQELITHTSGDFDEAIDWLRQLDQEYEITTDDYTIDDFIQELKDRGFIREEFEQDGTNGPGHVFLKIFLIFL